MADAPTDPAPRTETAFRENLGPNRASTMALKSGSAGASHRMCSMSPSHFTRGIVVERRVMFLEMKNQRQPHRHFRGRHRQDKKKHHLPVGLPPAGAGGHEGQSARVEHYFNAHQREDQVTPRE